MGENLKGTEFSCVSIKYKLGVLSPFSQLQISACVVSEIKERQDSSSSFSARALCR